MVTAARSLVLEHTVADRLSALAVPTSPRSWPDAATLVVNEGLALELGLDADELSRRAAAWFGGVELPEGAAPVAVAYAGHQFGHLNPSLGDGRALLLGEVVTPGGERVDVQLKGSGRTRFSRGGDGRAALDSVLREYLFSEAMHALGVPTTRALAAIATGDTILRDRFAPGAILVRTARSHLRVGTLEYLALRDDVDTMRTVVDMALDLHAPEREPVDGPARALFSHVLRAQAELVARWMSLGFVHGVMNTDNMALSGETLDYGPAAFLDVMHPSTVFSRVDTGGRYAYGRQPSIALWNLARLAEALLPLLGPDADAAIAWAEPQLGTFEGHYQAAWRRCFGPKLGLADATSDDDALLVGFLQHLTEEGLDFHVSFRRLADDLRAGRTALDDPGLADWDARWRARLGDRDPSAIADAMDAVNPAYILRNHRVEEALHAAVDGDLQPFHALLDAVTDPFVARPERAHLAEPPPPSLAPHQTHCNT